MVFTDIFCSLKDSSTQGASVPSGYPKTSLDMGLIKANIRVSPIISHISDNLKVSSMCAHVFDLWMGSNPLSTTCGFNIGLCMLSVS